MSLLLSKTFLHVTPIPQEIAFLTTICLHVNMKSHMACNFSCHLKLKDFLRRLVVTYTVNVVLSRQGCRIESLNDL